MRRALAALLCLALSTVPAPARADIVGPPGDPARHDKIVGIVVADVGVALLVGGVIMLGFAAAADPSKDVVLQRDLYLAGGLTTAVGGSMTVVGFLVWILARQKTADWLKQGKPGTVSLAPSPSGIRLTF